MNELRVVLLMVIFCGQVWADDNIENELYQSCVAASESKDSKVQAMCTCQAKKWAAGNIKSPTDPTETLEIKKEYVDNLIANWNYNIGIQDGAHLKGNDAERAAIAMNIGFSCAQELGAFKQPSSVKSQLDRNNEVLKLDRPMEATAAVQQDSIGNTGTYNNATEIGLKFDESESRKVEGL